MFDTQCCAVFFFDIHNFWKGLIYCKGLNKTMNAAH